MNFNTFNDGFGFITTEAEVFPFVLSDIQGCNGSDDLAKLVNFGPKGFCNGIEVSFQLKETTGTVKKVFPLENFI